MPASSPVPSRSAGCSFRSIRSVLRLWRPPGRHALRLHANPADENADLDIDALNEVFQALEARAARDFRHEGFVEAPRLVRSVDVRYVGQNWELNVPLPGGELIDRDIAAGAKSFEDEHERFYGYSIPGEELELLTFNVAAVGTRHSVELPKLAGGPQPEPIDRRPVVFMADEGAVETAVYDRSSFRAGTEIAGPAVVGQVDATTLLPPGSVGRVDEYGNLMITV